MQKLTTLERVSNRIDALSANCYDQNVDVPDISFDNLNTVNISREAAYIGAYLNAMLNTVNYVLKEEQVIHVGKKPYGIAIFQN